MKRIFLVFMILMLIMCLVGCSEESNDESTKNINISLLKSEFNNETIIIFDFLFEDKINAIRDGIKNQYLIQYIHKEAFFCGYIDEKINNKIKDKIWIKGDNLLYSFKNFLIANEIELEFEDIIWITYDNVDDISYRVENNNLLFIFKFNEVKFIEDIYGKKINQVVPHFISTDFLIHEDKVEIYDLNQLDEGNYFLYGHNLNIFKYVSFNKFIPQKIISSKYEQYILQRINENNLIIDCVECYENGTLIDMLNYKYGIYKENFENIIEKKKEIDNFIYGYWNYENYKNLFIDVLNGGVI